MPQKDTYHEAVKNALIKDGWTITHDPYPLRYGEHRLYVDIGAEGPLAAQKAGRKIAVEVKSFLGVSEMTELERSLGQFILYRFLLSQAEPERVLFLGVTRDTHAELFDIAQGRDLAAAQLIKLVTFDPAQEVIVEWIE